MIAIDNVLLRDEIIGDQFVCDLTSCKGACCVDGEAGAPLEDSELKELENVLEAVWPYLAAEGKAEIEKQGRYVYDKTYGWVTPTINGQICAYGFKDAQGVVKCGIEKAYLEEKISWKKPISCHLFPIITKNSKDGTTIFANYEPREDNCKAACALGEKLKVPVYQFLKEPIIRKFGEDFYNTLDAIAQHKKENK